MMHFGMAHNGTMETRDVAFRVDVPHDALEHLRDAKVAVVGGEAMPLRPGGMLPLPGMRRTRRPAAGQARLYEGQSSRAGPALRRPEQPGRPGTGGLTRAGSPAGPG